MQGYSNGPTCFNIAYQAFGNEVGSKRRPQDIASMTATIDECAGRPESQVELNKLVFADDHCEFGMFKLASEMKSKTKAVNNYHPA